MEEIKKMLRAVINGQSAMKQDLLHKIADVDKKVVALDKKIDGVEKRVTKRIDMQGAQLAELDDDAPSREEFGSLEKRVKKIERKLTIA